MFDLLCRYVVVCVCFYHTATVKVFVFAASESPVHLQKGRMKCILFYCNISYCIILSGEIFVFPSRNVPIQTLALMFILLLSYLCGHSLNVTSFSSPPSSLCVCTTYPTCLFLWCVNCRNRRQIWPFQCNHPFGSIRSTPQTQSPSHTYILKHSLVKKKNTLTHHRRLITEWR